MILAGGATALAALASITEIIAIAAFGGGAIMTLVALASHIRIKGYRSLSVIGLLIRAAPVALILILSAPAFLLFPFLSEARRQTVFQMADELAHWTRGESTAVDHGNAENKNVDSSHRVTRLRDR